MTERPEASPWLRLIGGFFVSATLALSPQVLAQDDEEETEEDEVEVTEEVIVTGSRIRRDTYTSVAPLQIISGQISREVGLLDAGQILQESTAASGQQIDLTFNGFVLDNGPGQTNINLRGLGGARTLVLVNGRRVAPGGVEGAPTAADLGLIPSSLVQQYDLLLDGASSIYGSDAVAGVVNVVMRKDFDGLEVEGFTSTPMYDGGVQNTLAVTYGMNFDRGFFGIGAEYTEQERTRLGQRPWTEKCDRNAEIDENGNIRSQNVWREVLNQMPWDDCKAPPDLFTIWGINGANQFLFWTPGETNLGVPNWSDWSEFGIADFNQDGIADVNFRDYTTEDKVQDFDLFGERETSAVTAYGEYTFAGEMNLTPFFEINWAERKFNNNATLFPLFPAIPANNPFNPCNADPSTGGVDCGAAQAAYYADPVFNANFLAQSASPVGLPDSTWEEVCPLVPSTAGPGQCTALGLIQAIYGRGLPSGPVGSPQHVVYVRGDRNNATVELPQTRAVVGLTGDLPMINFGSVSNWGFEVAFSYSESTGTSVRNGIRGDKLDFALGNFSSTGTPCVNDTGAALGADVVPGCIPVNLFAPSLLDPITNGEFATQAERDYLFGVRAFDTDYEQSMVTAFLSGDLFELPAGTVAGGFGIEYRHDELTSLPNDVAAQGLFFGFSTDEGAIGERDIEEAFFEVELPLFAGVQAAEEMTLNLSARWTNDEFYGSEWTESAKLGWRPVDNILIRGTYGTSFRAPNLRELFLANQTGFNNSFGDPCYIPLSAFDPVTEEYDPNLDQRDPVLLQNCEANGVNPRLAGINRGGDTTYPIEVRSGGALDLFAEESESWTAGFVFEVPTNAFDMILGATYYEIQIENSIIEPSDAFIVSDCYGNPSGQSPFCSRITRDFSDPEDPRVTLIDEGFINRDAETARGVDLNLTFSDQLTIAERPVEFLFDLRANRQLERSTLFVDQVTGERDFENFVGEFGFPTWKGRALFRLEYADWRVNWETNYIGSQDQDLAGVDEFEDAISGGSDTCLGAPTDVLCRDIGFAENYFNHALSVFYNGDNWSVGGGVRNVFNEAPPFVDGQEVFAINNAPIGYGYDLQGRTYFFNVRYSFTGLN